MNTLLLSLLACTKPETDVIDDSLPADESDDTPADTDTDVVVDTDTAVDTDTDVPLPVLPERLASRRWKVVFADEFDGPVANDPCYDPVQTPPMCLDRYWSRTTCGPAEVAALAGLNYCVWSTYDIYNWMDWGKPLGTGINNLDPLEVSVHGGSLWLNAHRFNGDGVFDCGRDLPDYMVSNDCPIRSGAIMSRPAAPTPGFAQTYGRFEVRAILPRGGGAWPAHWMLPVDGGWPEGGEIDIMEAVAAEPSVTTGNFHGGKWSGGTHIHQNQGNRHDTHDERFLDELHTYTVEWEPSQIRYYVDDIELGHLDDGQLLVGDVLSSTDGANPGDAVAAFGVDLPDTPFFFILNTSVVPTGPFDLGTFGPLVHRVDSASAFVPCAPEDLDPACVVRGTGTADLTTHAWMSGPKWSPEYRVLHHGDFDGDGVGDLLLRTASGANATYLLRGDGRGGFLHEDTLTDCCWMNADLWSDLYREGHVGDFDGDGDDDVLLQGRRSPHATYMMWSDGNGSFANQFVATDLYGMSYTHWAADSRTIHVADFNGDGADDLLLVGNTGGDDTFLLLADHAGGFSNVQTITTIGGMTAARWAAGDVLVADFDGNGGADILVRAPNDTGSTWLLRRDADTFVAENVTTKFGMDAQDWDAEWRESVVGDFDADGKSDLLLQGRGFTDRTLLLTGAGDGFANVRNITFSYGMNNPTWARNARSAHAGDFDGDGADDLLLQPETDLLGTTLFLRSNRAGGFEVVQDITKLETLSGTQWAASKRNLVVDDWDGDGADDVLLQGRNDTEKTYVVYLPL